MKSPHDWSRHALRNSLLLLFCLMIGLPGCGGSKPTETTAAIDPQQAQRRKEMREYMETHKNDMPKPKPPRNHP